MRFLIMFAVLGLAAAFASVPVDAEEFAHLAPRDASQVPISGWPLYVENLTIGTPVSDYGSHYGLKASVTGDYDGDPVRYLPAHAFLNQAHYAAFTDVAGQLDQAWIGLITTSSGVDLLAENPAREIEFVPFGWSETVQADRTEAAGFVMTVDEDAFYVHAEMTLRTSSAADVQPVVYFQWDGDGIDESLSTEPIESGYATDLSANGRIATIDPSSRPDLKRALAFRSPIRRIDVNPDSGRVALVGDVTSLEPGESVTLDFVIGVARSSEDARAIASLAMSGMDEDADAVWDAARAEWSSYFGSLPSPHSDQAVDQKLYQMAATGLRMNEYAPAGEMIVAATVPAKGHFNRFRGWETALAAVGYAESDSNLAKSALTTLFAGPSPGAFVELDDELQPPFGTDRTHLPAQGWAIRDIYRKDGMWDTQWLLAMFQESTAYMNWWDAIRDPDGDGLFRFDSGIEIGWEDSPRYHCSTDVAVCAGPVDAIEPVDLNAWLYAYYETMRLVSAELGFDDASELWRGKRDAIGAAIETEFWDEEFGTYFDLERNASGNTVPVRVLTPAMLYPLFVGVTTNPQRAKAILENYLLAPEHFWGEGAQFPVPSVAFSDAAYDSAQDGFYWQGQAFPINAYVAATALYRYGYEDESRDLVRRVLDRIAAADSGGIYEAYDAQTSRIGMGLSGRLLSGPGEPSAFLHGPSCSVVLQMLLSRQEAFRYLMPGETGFTGYVRQVRDILSGRQYFVLYDIVSLGPNVVVESTDGRPLDSRPDEILVRFTDPFENVDRDRFVAEFPRVAGGRVKAVAPDGTTTRLGLVEVGGGLAFTAQVSDDQVDHYLVRPDYGGDGGGDEGSFFGCGASGAAPGSQGLVFLILLSVLPVLRRVRTR